MTENDMFMYEKLKKIIEENGYVISSEIGLPDDQMFLTAYDKNNTKIQLNVRNKIAPPQRLKKKWKIE